MSLVVPACSWHPATGEIRWERESGATETPWGGEGRVWEDNGGQAASRYFLLLELKGLERPWNGAISDTSGCRQASCHVDACCILSADTIGKKLYRHVIIDDYTWILPVYIASDLGIYLRLVGQAIIWVRYLQAVVGTARLPLDAGKRRKRLEARCQEFWPLPRLWCGGPDESKTNCTSILATMWFWHRSLIGDQQYARGLDSGAYNYTVLVVLPVILVVARQWLVKGHCVFGEFCSGLCTQTLTCPKELL